MRRTSQGFRMEAPIGGWNTRDSLDNIPPSDAIIMTNWVPDLGEVKTRPGYSEHCWTGDATLGSNLIPNPGFEIAGGGGADVFASWGEAAGSGTIAQSTTQVHSGTYSCALGTVSGDESTVYYTFVTTASTTYTLKFWVWNSQVAGDFQTIQYRVLDVSNTAELIAKVSTVGGNEEWAEIEVQFTTTAGGISTRLYFYSPEFAGGSAVSYVDDVSVYQAHLGGDVETLAVYEKGAINKFIAADTGKFFDVSTAGSPTDITKTGTTWTNSRWQWANFDGKIGFVNGVDTPQQWAGTGLMTDLTITGPIAINVVGINVFKGRTWFWEDNSQDVWYSALNTLGGTCTKFPLSRVGQFGGNLIAMVTWTRDGGAGPDDYAVFIMSSGEAIIYQGSSPALGGDWALVGVYNIGEPLSIRSVVKYGGDIWIITRLDYVNLSQVLAGAEANVSKSKVVGALQEALGAGGSLWGWEAQVYPQGNLAIFNTPYTSGTVYHQHVMNTVTGAWCKFEGILSHTWQMYSARLFFGSADGYIYEFDTAQADAGDAIQSEFQTAWLPIGGYVNKMFTAAREFIVVNAELNTVNQFAVDYGNFSNLEYPVAVTSGAAEWGDPWGTPWTAYDQVFKDWQMIGVYGETISLKKRLSTKQRVRYLGASWLYEPGERL